MKTGTVKWYNASRGLGFITPDEGSEELHFACMPYSGIGSKSFYGGQKVRFDVKSSARGLEAIDVVPAY